MHDIKAIRDNPAAFDAGWKSRGLEPQTPVLLDLDQKLRAAQTAVQTAQSRRNEASKLIGQAKAQKDEAKAAALMAEVEALKAEMAAAAETEAAVGKAVARSSGRPAQHPGRDRAARRRRGRATPSSRARASRAG
jgi:seryl-tRNA synthetase